MFAFEMKKAKKEKSSRFAESENFHKTHVKGFLYDAVFFHDFSLSKSLHDKKWIYAVNLHDLKLFTMPSSRNFYI